MNDQELRQLVRQAVARQLGHGVSPASPEPAALAPLAPRPLGSAVRGSAWSAHPSHHLYLAIVNSDEACVIEPSVTCDHCGYCKSHGH